jgi:hypothetical protein
MQGGMSQPMISIVSVKFFFLNGDYLLVTWGCPHFKACSRYIWTDCGVRKRLLCVVLLYINLYDVSIAEFGGFVVSCPLLNGTSVGVAPATPAQ